MARRTRNARVAQAAQLPYAGWPVGLYVRASDDPKQTKSSVGDQEATGRLWVTREGAVLSRVYCDNDLSGSRFATKERGDFKQLIADVESGELKMIWFWMLSRQQRQLRVFAELRDLCRRKDVRWIVNNRVYNLKDRGDRLALGVQALMDEDLPEMISENVRQAFANNAAKGRPHGFTAYGWRRIYDENTGNLVAQVIDEEQAAMVRDIARRLAAGETLYAIADALNEAGHPTPRAAAWRAAGNIGPLPFVGWRASNLGPLLRRVSNIGKRAHNGVIVADAIWPPILDEDLYHECMRILSAPDRAIQHPTTIKYLLSGIARCGRTDEKGAMCNTVLRAFPRDGRMKYQCEKPSKCVAIRVDWADDYIEDLVLKRLARPDAIALLSRPGRGADVVAAENEVETLNRRMQEWYTAGRQGKANPVVVSNMVTQLMADIAAAEARAAVQRVSPLLREAARPDIADIWPDYELPKRRAIVAELLEIHVVPVGKGNGRTFEASRVPTRWRHE